MLVEIGEYLLSKIEITNANTIPMSPPVKLKITLSVRNWVKISLFFAPMAFLMPISRVLSVTETSIIFIIPIPPTSKEIAAMLLMTIIRVAAEPGQD